jgi:hypothetical protein
LPDARWSGWRLWAIAFLSLIVLHSPLLSLPYFWDEAGHYIPAARDFLLTGDVIPTTTISNAHPPLPMFYLAAVWSLFGYAPVVTRVAMLLISAFGLLQVFRIGERVANREVAVASTICAALYPVIFAQCGRDGFSNVSVGAAAVSRGPKNVSGRALTGGADEGDGHPGAGNSVRVGDL